MLTLVLDSATERGVLALFKDSKCCYQTELPFGYQNSKFILPKLQEGLNSLNAEAAELGLIIVGTGPGSYIGIRVGIMVAKTLSYVHKIPLVGVSTLQGLVPEQESDFAALIDAKMSGVYLMLRGSDQPVVCPLEEAAKLLQQVPVAVTPNGARLKLELKSFNGEWVEKAPSVQVLFAIGFKRYQEGLFSTEGDVEPLYLRKTQAEIEKDQRTTGKAL